jgi:hypothetical protein
MTRFSCWLVASLLVCVSALTAHAQSRTVQGSVHDADTGEPLVGAQIAVKGNPTVGTLARDDGNFSLTLPMQDVILVVKRLGYPQREVAVTRSWSPGRPRASRVATSRTRSRPWTRNS